mgnify:CR=1 FL=1
MTNSNRNVAKTNKVSAIQTLLLATVLFASAVVTSCTSEAIGETNVLKNATNTSLLNQKSQDTTGGQGGQIPPPRP